MSNNRHSMNEASNEAAKRLYFINFANHMTMKMNGEYEDYIKYNISSEIEHEWSLEVKDKLLVDILKEKDFLKVYSLSRVNLMENEILDAFALLAASPLKAEILQNIVTLKRLFEPTIYEKICELFK